MTNDERDQVIQHAVRQKLLKLGYDTTSEGLADTPRRVSAFLRSFCNPEPFTFTTFDAEGMDEMVVQTDIPFYSLCEHHMLPFFGTASVGYLPAGRLVGLSKLARAVQWCAAGLQVQERITKAVADMLHENLKPAGVGVVLRARHLCMEMRGVRVHDAYSTTSFLLGTLRNDEKARAEFLRLAKAGR